MWFENSLLFDIDSKFPEINVIQMKMLCKEIYDSKNEILRYLVIFHCFLLVLDNFDIDVK